jgi:AcrR family transcriptional regulator
VSIVARKAREREQREQRIKDVARQIATKEGWQAVTIRRLAEEIEYSQPVIYSHFRNRDAIVSAVAVDGFGQLATILRAAKDSAQSAESALERVATAYIDFAFGHSELYKSMLVLPTELSFAQQNVQSELRDAFGALSSAVAPFCKEADTATEALWAALHGLVELERHGRIRPALRADRLRLIIQSLLMSGHAEA